MLEIKHLSYQVEGESGEELGILNDVSLTVADHQFVVITGPNGGGKTTLAKAIMGLVRPTGGTIAWNGTDITGLDITQRARLGVSYGFQQPPRFKGLRVRDLLALAAGSEKLTREEGCQYLIVMIRDGKIAKHGPKDEIFPQILANTSAGCSYMSEGAR